MAFSTPYRMFKRYTYQGGVCDPLVIHWPAGYHGQGRGQGRQYHHSTDIVPTILEACGVEFPDVVDGYQQTPLSGVSMVYSFADAAAPPTTKKTQYYEMLGSRGIWHEGWKAVTDPRPHGSVPSGFDADYLAAVPHRRRPFGGTRSGWTSIRTRSKNSKPCGWKRPRPTTCFH